MLIFSEYPSDFLDLSVFHDFLIQDSWHQIGYGLIDKLGF